MTDVLEVQVNPAEVVQVAVTAPVVVEVAAVTGPPGPAGPSGVAGSVEIPVPVAAATWTVPVPVALGRTPAVSVYIDGELVDTDVTASPTTVTVTFPAPVAGTVVLT